MSIGRTVQVEREHTVPDHRLLLLRIHINAGRVGGADAEDRWQMAAVWRQLGFIYPDPHHPRRDDRVGLSRAHRLACPRGRFRGTNCLLFLFLFCFSCFSFSSWRLHCVPSHRRTPIVLLLTVHRPFPSSMSSARCETISHDTDNS